MKSSAFLLALTFSTQAFAGTLQLIKDSEAYKAYAQDKVFSCDSVAEVKTTKGYGDIVEAKTRFQLVVLNCEVDPRDGMDPIREKGLAVLKDGEEVLSFTASYYPQPD